MDISCADGGASLPSPITFRSRTFILLGLPSSGIFSKMNSIDQLDGGDGDGGPGGGGGNDGG